MAKQKTLQDYGVTNVEHFWELADRYLPVLDAGVRWQYPRLPILQARFDSDGSVRATYEQLCEQFGNSRTGRVAEIVEQAIELVKVWQRNGL